MEAPVRKAIVSVLVLVLPMAASAGIKFNFNNEEITKMIEIYSNAAHQKFIIDPSVRGRATITQADDVSVEEALNLLGTALAVNGYSFVKQGDTMLVGNARNLSR